MRLLACCAIALAGCSGWGEIDVGAGQIPPIIVTGYLEMPAQEAQQGGPDRSWDSYGTTLAIASTPTGVRVSAEQEIEFLPAEEVKQIKEQAGHRLNAVDRVDIQVSKLDGSDANSGASLAAFAPTVLAGDQDLGGPGKRSALAPDMQKSIRDSFKNGTAVDLMFGVALDCTPDQVDALPSVIQLRIELQPILVVQAAEAL